MELNIYKDSEELSKEVAKWITDYINATLQKQDRFTICLSGGSTPYKLNTLLVASPYKEKVEWNKLHVFWGDERGVPLEDDRNNAKMAFDTLLNHVPILPNQIHLIRTDVEPRVSAVEYEKILRHYFQHTNLSFDLVLLGMGDDGHTLSLFPGSPAIYEEEKWVVAYFLAAQNMYRITLTAPIVNRSAAVAFLVIGPSKTNALREVIEGDYQPNLYPDQLIKPAQGELYWFTDEAAASLLQ